MPVKAVTFDAYGTLLRNEDLMLIPRRIVADHGLSVCTDDVWRMWIDLYFEATQRPPFRTLREFRDRSKAMLVPPFVAVCGFALWAMRDRLPSLDAALAVGLGFIGLTITWITNVVAWLGPVGVLLLAILYVLVTRLPRPPKGR